MNYTDDSGNRPSTLHAFGRIVAREGHEADLLQALSEVVRQTRREPGNIHFDLYRGAEQPALFIIEESWQDAAALHTHVQTPHVQRFFSQAENLALAPLELTVIDPIESPLSVPSRKGA